MTAGLEILNLHAQGGMAEVYRARASDETGRSWYYAVKRMLPELLKEPEMMRMFIEEQRVAACLVHENIVRVYDVAQADGAADTFIVMEFLEGRDLSEVIEAAERKKRMLPVWFCIHVAREVLKALSYATTQARDKSGRVLGLIHRDISPHNIFVCKDGQVKLTDFGVARVETAEVRTKAGIIKGKFGYMSPEQLMAGQLDFRSDLYNVGIQLYESLTAKRLFFGETATQFIASMMQNEIPPLDKKLLVPPELDQLMRKSLSKKREERPQTAAAFEAQLAAIADKYNLVAQRGHIAGEMEALFPELLLHEPTIEPVLHTEPEERPPTPPSLTPRRPVQPPASPPRPRAPDPDTLPPDRPPPRVPTKAKRLTFVSQAPSSAQSEEQPVFTETRARHEEGVKPPTAVKAAPPKTSGAKPAPVSSMSPPRPPPPQRPASAPAAVIDDDELVPTLLEPRPSFEELGLEPAQDDAPMSAEQPNEAAQTEPTRLPAFAPGGPSSTAPGGVEHFQPSGPGVVISDEELDASDAPTSETRLPDLKRPPVDPAAPPRAHRVSTGSRRVISLADDDEKPKKR